SRTWRTCPRPFAPSCPAAMARCHDPRRWMPTWPSTTHRSRRCHGKTLPTAPETLTLSDRRLIAREAIILLEQAYGHLPIKGADGACPLRPGSRCRQCPGSRTGRVAPAPLWCARLPALACPVPVHPAPCDSVE